MMLEQEKVQMTMMDEHASLVLPSMDEEAEKETVDEIDHDYEIVHDHEVTIYENLPNVHSHVQHCYPKLNKD
jgi:hypothetical protein